MRKMLFLAIAIIIAAGLYGCATGGGHSGREGGGSGSQVSRGCH